MKTEKMKYEAPMLTSVTFRVEKGYAASRTDSGLSSKGNDSYEDDKDLAEGNRNYF